MDEKLTAKVKKSVERLQLYVPPEGYFLAFSGGKDSVVTKAIADLAGVKYHAEYRVTSVDPPELVRFIKEVYPDVKRTVPFYSDSYINPKLRGKPITMWNLIPEKNMPPTRLARFCCEKLKESGGDGGIAVTGVRWAESVNRQKNQGAVVIQGDHASKMNMDEDQQSLFDDEPDAIVNERHGSLILTNDSDDSRRIVENCIRRHKVVVNPIIEWTDADVWEFIRVEGIPYCSLYDEGYKRLGCIGCPMASTDQRLHDFERWPKHKHHYLLAFDRMLARSRERHEKDPSRPVWRTGGTDVNDPDAMDVYRWWMELNDEWEKKKKGVKK